MLKHKKIIIGVSGSIAAYKIAILTRLFIKKGAKVRVIMTTSASEFISPVTLATLSKNSVLTKFIKNAEGEWNNHVELGLWADAFVIAPATANTLARCANGLCDNLLTAVYLSARCPVFFAPAMDLDMYQHPSTEKNITTLKEYGNQLIPSVHGELASGLIGEGRMAEPEDITNYLEDFFKENTPLQNKKVLITAGPTQEAIDPVRYISNHSSGKMGYALAEVAATLGAEVYLISGPTHLTTQHSRIKKEAVTSAQEMYQAAKKYFAQADIIVLAAAIADYTPIETATQKIKKQENQNSLSIALTKTIDIAKTLGQIKKPHQLLVGFALETQNELENAKKKLLKKNLDLIVLNSLNDEGAGFGHNTNKVTLIDKHNSILSLPLKSKAETAKDIFKKIIKYLDV